MKSPISFSFPKKSSRKRLHEIAQIMLQSFYPFKETTGSYVHQRKYAGGVKPKKYHTFLKVSGCQNHRYRLIFMGDLHMISKLLKAAEVASILDVSKSFVYQMIRTGELPSVRFGTAVRVKPEDLEAFLQECSNKDLKAIPTHLICEGKKQ